jgi:hypothetical protein
VHLTVVWPDRGIQPLRPSRCDCGRGVVQGSNARSCGGCPERQGPATPRVAMDRDEGPRHLEHHVPMVVRRSPGK